MKLFYTLLFISLFLVQKTNGQCTISSTTNSSSLTCGVSPLNACNGVLNIGNGSAFVTLVMNSNLDLTCLGPINIIVNNGSIDFSPGNNRLYLAEGSSITFINGGTLVGGSCNASERIYVGGNLLATCNGGAGADVSFDTIVNLGGTGSLNSNSPVCAGNSIFLAATSPPNGGPYTYSFSGPNLAATAYSSSNTYSLVASNASYGGSYTVSMKSAAGTIIIAERTVVVNSGSTTAAPTVSTTQTSCSSATGSITITAPTGSGLTYSINNLNYSNTNGVFSNLAPGNYSVTVRNSSNCVSPIASVTINTQPITPTQPTIGTITQPNCSTATGSFVVSNYNASYSYLISPSTGVTRSGNTVTAPAGNYSVVASSGSCNSIASATVTINSQPLVPVQPLINNIIQPDCTNTMGSFVISNYNASYSYAISPSTGVTRSGNTVTAPAGSYNVTATLSSCSSIASSTITINPQRVNTWNGTNWSLGSSPNNLDRIVFNGNFSSSSDVLGCACTVNSGNVVFNSGNSLIITNEVTVSGGSLTFENDASLVQINNSSVNSGSIIYKRRTTPLKQYDYTYWSSPVANASLSQLATNSLFYSFDPNINNWAYQISGAIMAQGKGYIGRAPSGLNYAASNQQVVTNFNGVPNNGIINPTIVKSATSGHNLIGNPYSSAIDIDLFLTNSTNDAIFNSTIYLWTHNTAITNNVYTADDYAKYNLTGGVKTASAASTGGATPTGKVAAGQGFFIEAKSSLANGNYSARFDNSMRISGNNNQFFRTALPERHRFWVSINSPQGAFNEMLIGYVEGATNDFDSKYDGKTMQTNNSVFIAMPLNDLSLAIQAKALPFSSQDIIPFIYSTTVNGTLSINLENFDGLFSSQDIYLLDKFTYTYHNLKDSNYTFTTSSGTFNNRFEIRFTTNALGVTNPESTENSIKIFSNNNSLSVLSSNEKIEKVVIYDLLGKLIFTSLNDLDRNEFNTCELNISPQVLLVKVSLSNGVIVSQKAIIK